MTDGYIVYQGDAKKAVNYFSSISDDTYYFKCPTYANPCDFFMKILSINYPKEKEDDNKVAFLKEKYETYLI